MRRNPWSLPAAGSLFVAIAPLLAIALLAAPAFAHHGAAAYDLGKTISSQATFTSITWTNPHCLLNFDMKDDTGEVRHWHVEIYNPTYMTRAGWSKNLIKPGDQITITFHPARNGQPNGYIRAGDGKIVYQGKELSLNPDDGSSPADAQ